MPYIANLVGQNTAKELENQKLWLPSDFNAGERQKTNLTALALLEQTLCQGEDMILLVQR